jgi:hypothetical protein
MLIPRAKRHTALSTQMHATLMKISTATITAQLTLRGDKQARDLKLKVWKWSGATEARV